MSSRQRMLPMFTNETDEWETPPELFRRLDREFQFTLDPAATKENAKTRIYYDKAADGMGQSWFLETVWLNPPYSEVGHWMEKAKRESLTNEATVVALVPARTDTAWFHNYVLNGAMTITFLRGRVKFLRAGPEGTNAPFPSMIVVYQPGEPPHSPPHILVRGVDV